MGVTVGFSQEKKGELTGEEKEELRKSHNPTFKSTSKRKKSSTGKIKVTSSKEQSSNDIKKTTKVKHY
jgi:hypothetical protein